MCHSLLWVHFIGYGSLHTLHCLWDHEEHDDVSFTTSSRKVGVCEYLPILLWIPGRKTLCDPFLSPLQVPLWPNDSDTKERFNLFGSNHVWLWFSSWAATFWRLVLSGHPPVLKLMLQFAPLETEWREDVPNCFPSTGLKVTVLWDGRKE